MNRKKFLQRDIQLLKILLSKKAVQQTARQREAIARYVKKLLLPRREFRQQVIIRVLRQPAQNLRSVRLAERTLVRPKDTYPARQQHAQKHRNVLSVAKSLLPLKDTRPLLMLKLSLHFQKKARQKEAIALFAAK